MDIGAMDIGAMDIGAMDIGAMDIGAMPTLAWACTPREMLSAEHAHACVGMAPDIFPVTKHWRIKN